MGKKVYEYGCAMLYVDFPEIEYLHSMINKSDLHSNGKEYEPHITLLYGFNHEPGLVDGVKSIISTFNFNTLISNNIGLFKNEDFDVIKLEIEDRTLRSINRELKEFSHVSLYPNYNPHLTIAYLKPGKGEEYLKIFREHGFDLFYLEPSHVIYSYPDKDKKQTVKHKINIKMPLNKKSDAESYIKDFMKSKASQFKGKSREDIKKMALAAYYDSKNKSELKEAIKDYFKGFREDILESEGKYSHINFKPPQSVANAAKRGLEYRKKNNGKGGLSKKQASKQGIGSGVQRAIDLKNRDNLSPETIKRMVSFFARHAKNKSIGKGKKAWEDKGHVAWLLWGGDPGKSWAEKIKAQMDKADEKSKNETRSVVKELLEENFDIKYQVINPNIIFTKFKEAELISHYKHLTTSSYSEHKALGDFYESIVELTDDILETVLKDDKSKLQCSSINVDFSTDCVSFLHRFKTYVIICEQSCSRESVKDVLIQTEKLIDQTLYLLTLQ